MLLETWKALPSDDDRIAASVRLTKGYSADEIKILDAARQVRFVISTSSVDRDRDTVAVDGWDLDDYRRNPVVQWAHNYAQPPIARAVSIGVTDGKLGAVAEFPEAEVYAFADTIYRLVRSGYLNATSVGFRPLEWTINEERRGVDFLRQTLLEFSVVPIPSNPQALVEARSAGTLTADDQRQLLGWAEEVLDTWHGEKGLWLPKAQVEATWKVLATQMTRSGPACDTPSADALSLASAAEDAHPDTPENAENATNAETPSASDASVSDETSTEENQPVAAEVPAVVEQPSALEGEVVDDDDLETLVAGLFAEDYHHTAPPDLLGLDPDTFCDVLTDVVRDSVTEALKRSMTAVTGRLID